MRGLDYTDRGPELDQRSAAAHINLGGGRVVRVSGRVQVPEGAYAGMSFQACPCLSALCRFRGLTVTCPPGGMPGSIIEFTGFIANDGLGPGELDRVRIDRIQRQEWACAACTMINQPVGGPAACSVCGTPPPPVRGPDLVALKTSGDGSCMANAASLALTGGELFSAALRAEIRRELEEHKNYYLQLAGTESDYIKWVQEAMPGWSYDQAGVRAAGLDAGGAVMPAVDPPYLDATGHLQVRGDARGWGESCGAGKGGRAQQQGAGGGGWWVLSTRTYLLPASMLSHVISRVNEPPARHPTTSARRLPICSGDPLHCSEERSWQRVSTFPAAILLVIAQIGCSPSVGST
jgi:hypothetical protein